MVNGGGRTGAAQSSRIMKERARSREFSRVIPNMFMCVCFVLYSNVLGYADSAKIDRTITETWAATAEKPTLMIIQERKENYTL